MTLATGLRVRARLAELLLPVAVQFDLTNLVSLELGCVTGARRDASVSIADKQVAPIQRTP